jgi:hypothetical protein
MQLALDLPLHEQRKPGTCALRKWAERRAAARNALFWPKDETCAQLADFLFDQGCELSVLNETLRGSAKARRWIAKLERLGIVERTVCPIFNRARWKARRFN